MQSQSYPQSAAAGVGNVIRVSFMAHKIQGQWELLDKTYILAQKLFWPGFGSILHCCDFGDVQIEPKSEPKGDPDRHKTLTCCPSACLTCVMTVNQVGGLGLTLTAADRVIIIDPAWNPSVDNQVGGSRR